MFTASEIIDLAARTLNDRNHAYWTEPELREYVSEAQRACVLIRPEVNPVTQSLQLVPGTKQEIPADGYLLIDVVRNMGLDGRTPGRVITPTERASLDQTTPDWHTRPANAVVRNFIYDIRNRRTFYVTPPQPETPHLVEIIYAKTPAELESGTDHLGIDDIYQPAVLAYTLYRAKQKDMQAEGQGMAMAGAYWQWFMQALTGEAEKQDADLTIRHETMESNRGA